MFKSRNKKSEWIKAAISQFVKMVERYICKLNLQLTKFMFYHVAVPA